MSLNKTKVSQPLEPAEVIKQPGPVHAPLKQLACSVKMFRLHIWYLQLKTTMSKDNVS